MIYDYIFYALFTLWDFFLFKVFYSLNSTHLDHAFTGYPLVLLHISVISNIENGKKDRKKKERKKERLLEERKKVY